jgi:hypothetical protein
VAGLLLAAGTLPPAAGAVPAGLRWCECGEYSMPCEDEDVHSSCMCTCVCEKLGAWWSAQHRHACKKIQCTAIYDVSIRNTAAQLLLQLLLWLHKGCQRSQAASTWLTCCLLNSAAAVVSRTWPPYLPCYCTGIEV